MNPDPWAGRPEEVSAGAHPQLHTDQHEASKTFQALIRHRPARSHLAFQGNTQVYLHRALGPRRASSLRHSPLTSPGMHSWLCTAARVHPQCHHQDHAFSLQPSCTQRCAHGLGRNSLFSLNFYCWGEASIFKKGYVPRKTLGFNFSR